ncbi:HTH-type transcriptional regulator McbR [Pigmentiphaga humi]|uniref:HTH-type transcriptional regulator McbR n=1 Tax=Pigmentiphaga humi TaxID=2478468 RepID=A0A3P4B8B5_9BURK|nr:GntR family transcriptional regulator [Pigmentiphaga humi]VCU71766.1 HTH-type transcriptional regulator McbR [Pigmentiphaga humi]
MQQTTTMLHIREMILRGELAPGERVREADLAARLGTSRTPVRQALPALAQEGLLVQSGARGFAVRAFSARESLEALHLRAALEGLAARALATHGASDEMLAELKDCLDAGDRIFATRQLADGDEIRYAEMNAHFHALILEGAQMPLLANLVGRCNVVPFTDPMTLAFDTQSRDTMFNFLFYAHRQHHAIVAAIENGQADRAENLFREHAYNQIQSQGAEFEKQAERGAASRRRPAPPFIMA